MKYKFSFVVLLAVIAISSVQAAPPCGYDVKHRRQYKNPVHTNGCDYNWGMIRAQEPIVTNDWPHLITRDTLNTSSTRAADARRLGFYCPHNHRRLATCNREGFVITPRPGRTIIIHDEQVCDDRDRSRVRVIRNPLIEMKSKAKEAGDKAVPADYLFRIPIPKKENAEENKPQVVDQDTIDLNLPFNPTTMASTKQSPNTIVMAKDLKRPDHAYVIMRRDGRNIIYVQD